MEVFRIGLERNLNIKGSKTAWARSVLAEALACELKPKLIQQSEVDSLVVRLPKEIVESICSVARQHGLSPVMAAAGLIGSACDRESSNDAGSAGDHLSSYVTNKYLSAVRPELHAWLQDGVQEALEGKIVAMEAATGSGKGRAICAAALTHVSRGSSVTISAPLEVLFQLSDSFSVFAELASGKHGILLGRPNFVNEKIVLDHAIATTNQELKDWINQGGKPLGERAAAYAKATSVDLAYLMEDAISLADDLPIRESQLSTQDDCEAQSVYETAKSGVTERPILLMSHHMLAAGMYSGDDRNESQFAFFRRGDQLIIDEAHLFEEALSSLTSTTLHASVLGRRFSGYPKVKRACEALYDVLCDVCVKGKPNYKSRYQQAFCNSDSAPMLLDAIVKLNELIEKHVKGEAKRRELQAYIAGLKQIHQNLKNPYAMTKVSLSPVKKLPSISSGSYLLTPLLQKIWQNYSGIMLVSATLLGSRGDAALMSWILRLPKDRLSVVKPVTPNWIAQSLEIHRSFTNSVDFGSEEWLDQVSEKCMQVIGSAKGGILILNTSFETCDALAARLRPILNERLIVQSSVHSLAYCKAKFIELYRSGVMPVWIGVGRAWVGVDLTDESVSAKHDNMISDLIIPKIPYQISQSMASQYRNSAGHYGVMAQEAAWVLRQGIGRLVRRQGCPKKHVWLLDGRIVEPAHEIVLKNLERF